MRLLLCVILITATMANTHFLGTNDKVKATLKAIDTSDFGKNLLDTIALQLESKGPMTDIANLIRDMITDLQKQQHDADESHAAKMEECKTQKADYNARITHATNEIQEATQAIRELTTKRSNLKKAIVRHIKTLEMLDANEKAARAKRKVDNKLFFDRQEQTKLVLDALEVIIPKLKAITPHTAAETFMQLAKIGASNPIAALVEVASSLDADALARCIGLLEDLQGDFSSFLESDLQNEINAQVKFDNYMIEIAEMRKQTKQQLANDRAELAETEAALVAQRRRLAENNQELDSATKGLSAKTVECNLYDSNYQNDTKQRSGELDILEQVAAIVASRLAGLQEFIEVRK
jgi:chromosome segregation ATPase